MFSHSRIFPITLNILATLFLLFDSAILVTPVYAAGITVNTTVDENNTGANCSLREAITAANTDAAYGGCTAGSGADTITFAANYTITLGSQLPVVTDTMIITGNGAANTIIQASADSNTATYRVFEVGLTGDLTLDGLTVRHGSCATSLCTTIFNTSGGGIINSGTLTVKYSIISDNSASDNGGGIFNDGTLTVTDSTILNNSADNGGGILNNSNSDMTVSYSTFLDNSGLGGGAVYNYGGTLTMTNSKFDHNNATDGGGIYNSGTLNMTNIFFFDSTATNGGGIYNETTAVIANSTFQENTATANGSGIHNTGDLTVTNSTFLENLVASGIYNTGDLTVTNSTFSKNFASSGGGIYNGGALALNNSILANTANGNSDCTHAAGTLSGANNIIETTSTCSSVATITSDPNLGTLITVNLDPPFFQLVFPLNPGSPAIDAGNDTICAADPVSNTSQNGVSRPQGVHCDIGSFEFPSPDAAIDLSIGGTSQEVFTVLQGANALKTYAGFSGGPVLIDSTNNAPVVSSLRLLYNNKTFSELMGVPTDQLSNDYWLPYYANIPGTDTQIRFTNTDPTLSTTVDVYLGDNPTPVYTNTLLPETADRFNLPSGTTGGPVHIVGTAGVDILAGMRVIYGGNKSFDELMAYPTAQLGTEYWFPFYNHNNVNLDTQVRVANTSSTTPAPVDIYIGDTLMDTTTIDPLDFYLRSFPGVNGGPVRVVSTSVTPIPIVASLRLLYNNKTFSELMGVPTSQLSNDYWLPYYANIPGTDTQIRFTNTDPALSTTVNIYLGDNPTPLYTNTLLPETADRINLPSGTTGGPVHIVGSPSIDILAGMRVIYGGNKSFDELMAYPTALLSPEYWFPFYNHNNVNLDTQVKIGVP